MRQNEILPHGNQTSHREASGRKRQHGILKPTAPSRRRFRGSKDHTPLLKDRRERCSLVRTFLALHLLADRLESEGIGGASLEQRVESLRLFLVQAGDDLLSHALNIHSTHGNAGKKEAPGEVPGA